MKLKNILTSSNLESAQKAELKNNEKDYTYNSIITGIALAASLTIGAVGMHAKNRIEKAKINNADRIEQLEGSIGKPCEKDYNASTADKLKFETIVKNGLDPNHTYDFREKILGTETFWSNIDSYPKSPVFCQVINNGKLPDRNLTREYLMLKEAQTSTIDPVLAAALAQVVLIGIYWKKRRKTNQSEWAFLYAKLEKFMERFRDSKDNIEEKLVELKELEDAFGLLIDRERQLKAELKDAMQPESPYRDKLSDEQQQAAKAIRMALNDEDYDGALAHYRGEQADAETEDLPTENDDIVAAVAAQEEEEEVEQENRN